MLLNLLKVQVENNFLSVSEFAFGDISCQSSVFVRVRSTRKVIREYNFSFI